jgi:hypothetical protein
MEMNIKKRVQLPQLHIPTTIHIQHILSSFFEGEELVIYRRYISARGLWVEEMCYRHELDRYEI